MTMDGTRGVRSKKVLLEPFFLMNLYYRAGDKPQDIRGLIGFKNSQYC